MSQLASPFKFPTPQLTKFKFIPTPETVLKTKPGNSLTMAKISTKSGLFVASSLMLALLGFGTVLPLFSIMIMMEKIKNGRYGLRDLYLLTHFIFIYLTFTII